MSCQDRWQAENIACEDMKDCCKKAQDQVDGEFQVQLLVLNCERVQALQKQNAILAWAMQAMDND